MMGVVYEVHDPALGRTIALKTIHLAAGSEAERGEYERRFLAEARIAARLTHPGIVIVHDVGRDAEKGILFIALEHLHGRTLAQIAGEGRPDWREALRIVARVAEALDYAHADRVVHRDITPANIIVLPAGWRRTSRTSGPGARPAIAPGGACRAPANGRSLPAGSKRR